MVACADGAERHHPHAIAVYDVVVEAGAPGLVMAAEYRFPDGSRRRQLHRSTFVPDGADGLLLDVDEFVRVREPR